MAKKKKVEAPVPAQPPVKPVEKRPTQTKIELPPDELAAIRELARSLGMTLATFVKVAVKEKVRRIKEGKE